MTIARRIKQYKALHTKSHREFQKRWDASIKVIEARRRRKAIYCDGKYIAPYDWRRKTMFLGQGYAEYCLSRDGEKRKRPHYSVLGEFYIYGMGKKYSLFTQVWKWVLGAGIAITTQVCVLDGTYTKEIK